MQEMRPSDLARQFLTCPNFAKLCGKWNALSFSHPVFNFKFPMNSYL
jgi:hypothetical protein